MSMDYAAELRAHYAAVRVRVAAPAVASPVVAAPLCLPAPEPPKTPANLAEARRGEIAAKRKPLSPSTEAEPETVASLPKKVFVREVQAVVAAFYGISVAAMISARRMRELVRPRHIAMYLASETTGQSLPAIGRLFGGRDHTTVLHAVRKIERQIAASAELAAEIEALRFEIDGLP